MLHLTLDVILAYNCLQLFDITLLEFKRKDSVFIDLNIVNENVSIQSLPSPVHFASDLRSTDILNQNVQPVYVPIILEVRVIEVEVVVLVWLVYIPDNCNLFLVNQYNCPIRWTLCATNELS